MDDEARRSDQENSIRTEGLYKPHNSAFKDPKKHVAVAVKRKMELFENQTAEIRARLEARRELVSSDQSVRLPAVNSTPTNTTVAVKTLDVADRLKFPLLRQIDQTREANAPPQDPFLEVENVIHRTIAREIYDREAGAVVSKEHDVALTTKEAQQLGEEARKRMVTYTQHESGWKFEERTSRYQQVMEMKQQAEKAQQEADLQRETAQQMKVLLRDPYEELRFTPASRNALTPLYTSVPIPLLRKKEHEWIWVLASPSSKLSFTPREETVATVMDNERELSMYVVYYIASSDVNRKRVETEEQWQETLNKDIPPTDGWICCSVHGVPPAPELTLGRSGIQTWIVTGAGTGHLNDKFVACGVHDRVRRFKSPAGVELFRKCVPATSSFSRSLYGGGTETGMTEDQFGATSDSSNAGMKPSDGLSSEFASIDKGELDFRSMECIGSCLSMNEAAERNRRMLASRDAMEVLGGSVIDGHNVMNQESREVLNVAESRSEVNSPLCREWVMFARCSKRRVDTSTGGANEPPMKGLGLGCLKRHYYISFEEKQQMTVWVQTKESWLEKNVLTVIIEREAHIERAHHLSRKCMTNFQQNLRAEMERSKMKLLLELNRIRFLTVKVFETIDRWRQHARKIGFSRYENQSNPRKEAKKVDTSSRKTPDRPETEAPLLGWSVSITLDTGKQLYKGSTSFVSKIKRFRRSEDITGKREQHIVYLGYYETQEEAERAYDEHAADEAHRLNTTVEHLPRRRHVFRSCGKHFAVESEKEGPSFCIECKTKQLASLSSAADDWVPPFFYGTGVNYIMKMANDLDFLDDVLPLKSALNSGRGADEEAFPMRGNVFLLPKTPAQDPDLVVFTTFPTPTAPRLGEPSDSHDMGDVDDDALDRERIFKAQQIFLQELQIYKPELLSGICQPPAKEEAVTKSSLQASVIPYRLVEALYWDHCAALKIQQERPPLALRQPNIWCRPDAGEWASLIVRGTHQLHFLFEEKLEKAGKEMVQRRAQVLSALRQLNKVPLYFIPSRTSFTELIGAGQQVRGDVVQLEVNIAIKRLQRYDSWCAMSLVVQRWFRGVLGRCRARATRKALRFTYKLRLLYSKQVAVLAKTFYEAEVQPAAVRRAYKAICTPAYTRAVTMDGEFLIVMFHSLRHYQIHHQAFPASKQRILPSSCCVNCARRFHVKASYQSGSNKLMVYHGVCTCSLNGGSTSNREQSTESWFIRAYSPSHNVIYRLRLETPQLQQLLSSQTQSTALRYCPLILEMEAKRLEAAVASRYATFCFENSEKAAKNLTNWRRMNSESTQIRKSLLVELERSLSLLDTTKHAHFVSVGNAKKALDFASRPFSEAQAWDPLENANDWRFIVEKRQLTKRLEETHQEVERLRVAYFQATYNEHYARAGALRAQDESDRYWLPLVQRQSQSMEEAILQETRAKARMENVMEQLCGRFLALRDGYLVPTRRNLVIQSPMWHDMAPFRVDVPGLRRRLHCLRRRTLVLSNLAPQKTKTRRMIVNVSRLPLSRGNRASQDLWVTAYDPVDCSVHNIFLEWELVELLIGSSGRKLWRDPSQSKRNVRRSIADTLLSLTMLDRFTGEFTLEKLQFYHTLRRLSPQFLTSRVMRDLQAGRKCGQGDEVLRQAVSVDGRLCTVVVYENWGDMTFTIYHTASGEFYRLALPLREVFDLLESKPLVLRLWVSCVKSNSYNPTILVRLIKHVRFYQREDGSEDVRIEHELPAQTHSKRFQTVIRIQKRKLLVRITEDTAGDFQVSGYDAGTDFSYKLLLEREVLHRLLKSSDSPTVQMPSPQSNLPPSSLLLRRNRKMLYQWICGHLRFQSMMEHPNLTTSGASPLLFGLHVRESFRILNRWVTTSPRNPIQIVSEAEITRKASVIDAAAFSCLLFDQLSLVSHPNPPFGLEKEFVGSLDWTDATARQSLPHEPWQKLLPCMRMDFFMKTHSLFARVRGELEAETIERKKRETWVGMEQEDYNALCSDIAALMKSAKEYVFETLQSLAKLHTIALKRIQQWHQIHSELRVRIKTSELGIESGKIMIKTVDAAQMMQEDNIGVILDFTRVWLPTASMELHEFISVAVPVNSCSPIITATSLVHELVKKFESELKPMLSTLELIFDTVKRKEDGLEELRTFKGKVLQFDKFLARRLATFTLFDEPEADTSTRGDKGSVLQTDTGAFRTTQVESTPTSTANVGLFIPSNYNDSIEEVFLADVPTSEPMSFVVHAQTMVNISRSFFKKKQQVSGSRFGSNGCGDLICLRVPNGTLVCQTTGQDAYTRTQLAQFNTRAAALTGSKFVYGPALFCPLRGDCQRLLNCADIHRILATTYKGSELEEAPLQYSTLQRSAKYLPWKQFAIERLRISQAVKRSRSHEGMCLELLEEDPDEVEKQNRTITTFSVEFRQLEISFGKCCSHEFLRTTNSVKYLKKSFALHPSSCQDDSTIDWKLSICNPQILRGVTDIYDSDGRAIEIPIIDCGAKEGFTMERIQVELDSVDNPRRLIFSYREPNTQRRYFVDCDYYCLQNLLLQRQRVENPNVQLPVSLLDERECRHRATILSVHGWKQLAAHASKFLAFRKKNGVFSLCLEMDVPKADEVQLIEVEASRSIEGSSTPTDERLTSIPKVEAKHSIQAMACPVQQRCRAEILEERKVIQSSMLHHFQKHQAAVRGAASGRILATTTDTAFVAASEWMQMIQEDWRSQELRGMLVLEASVLSKLEKVYTPATKRARDYLKSSGKEDDVGGLELQLSEIAKAMTETVMHSNAVEILQGIRMKRWRRRGKDATPTAKRAEAYLADVSEWWRCCLMTMQLEKSEIK
ncbi:hypothetical protein P3T76_001232 [Phytophthora citrophthora]|uniref:Uncharacterized protein n=1 Tax=Phytophthora citrophthora TaxID=4793 RepID=A0AAD9GYU8_9STRA|nr:hypothetical protein P3T76_001232 [Phytophthora citrophthora]